jgi:hypothetical protein
MVVLEVRTKFMAEKNKASTFCDFHNRTTHSTEECREQPKNQRKQRTEEHDNVVFRQMKKKLKIIAFTS